MTNFMMVIGYLSLYLLVGFICLLIASRLEQAESRKYRRGF